MALITTGITAALTYFIKRRIKKAMLQKLKAALRRKAVNSMSSATMGVAAAFVAAAAWLQTHPEVVAQVVGAGWGGVVVAVAGVVVAIARARTL